MRRKRPNRKAPEIDTLARHYLRRGLSQHPGIANHIERVEEVEEMGMWSLLDLARKMGVDADEMIRKTEKEEDARSDYSWKYPGFKGELPLDLTFTLLGKSVTRKAKVVYEHTPEWPYFDLRKQAEYPGWEGTKYHVELAAVPEVYEDDDDHTVTEGEPEWFESDDITRDGVLPDDMWHAVIDAVDEKCKVDDAERRRIAAAKRVAVKPKSTKKH